MSIIPQLKIYSWKNVEILGDLERLLLVLEYVPDEKFMRFLEKKRGKGRNDYPIRAIWNSMLAGIVFQHPSVESLIRELNRNSGLADLCGFESNGEKYLIPKSWNYSRFLKILIIYKDKVREIFDNLVSLIAIELPDFGTNIGMDSKAINSVAKKKSKKGDKKKQDKRRDNDANYGKKEYKGVDKNGELWSKTVKWFGFKLHLIADVDYELPIHYQLTKASESDTNFPRPMMSEINEKHEELMNRIKSFLADKGYDSLATIKELQDEYNINPVIDIRNMRSKTEQEKLLDSKIAGNITYDYAGTVYCYCPATNKRRNMVFAGYEKSRNTLKFRCPAVEYGTKCKGKETCCGKNKSRIVRIPIETDPRVFLPFSRTSYKFQKLYKKRTALERINSRLDVSFGFENHYIRGQDKMEVSCGIAFIVMLSMAFGRIKQKKLELMRSLVKAA